VTLLAWACYLALEPSVRRLWPRVLTTWNRLLEGRIQDPKVGADLLTGAVCGTLVYAVAIAGRLAPAAFGWPTHWPSIPHSDAYLGPADAASLVCIAAVVAVTQAFSTLTGFLVCRLLFRRFWPAAVVCVLIQAAFYTTVFYGASFRTDPVFGLLVAASLAAVLFRLGFLPLVSACFLTLILALLAPDLRPAAAESGGRLIALAAAVAPAVWGFYTSLAGRPMFPDDLGADAIAPARDARR
jgi:hypothetical protein